MKPPSPRTRSDIDTEFRTGTVLRSGRWLPATALLVLATLTGISRQVAETSAADTFADLAEPGAIGFQRRPQPGPCPESVLPHHMQPVEIRGPAGMLAAIETASGWSPLGPAPLRIALVVGAPYRLRVGGIEGRDGEELYPSVRVLAKVATPAGMAWRFPVEITLDDDDLAVAADGAHVRRVVYAACEVDRPDVVPGGSFDVRPGDDCLEVARTLGEPVAEIVIGNRQPARDVLP